ncbi:hypothetical protein NVT68_000800 [Clostridium botulinum]|uniref:hypothetical protein n=1 Tax=Clostridium TaxID=1485 RepID=UPI000B16C5DA|nr:MULTISPECIES: hypothetical protein [Clostridium]MDI6918164.1 hypothetical protein [Clostridium botulinum]WMU98436.1 hypothetical protein QA656_03960 [Clostridium botulinum]
MQRQKEYGLAMKMEKGKERSAIFNKLRNDEYANQCFLDKLKFCRFIKKVIRGKNRYLFK